jgi:hypothetical protein
LKSKKWPVYIQKKACIELHKEGDPINSIQAIDARVKEIKRRPVTEEILAIDDVIRAFERGEEVSGQCISDFFMCSDFSPAHSGYSHEMCQI